MSSSSYKHRKSFSHPISNTGLLCKLAPINRYTV